MSFTKEQNQAITSRERNLLVSASAGSGKTTVMIERILSLIEEGASLENMVVCTFTRSAAADMRDKLQNALLRRVGDGTEFSAVAERELTLLPTAEISTLHSWCQRLIRNYFYVVGADPAFEIADEEEASAMLAEAIDEAVEQRITSADDDFSELYDVMLSGRKDTALKKLVRDLYHYSEAQSDPEAWLSGGATEGLRNPGLGEEIAEQARKRLSARFLPRAKELLERISQSGFKRNYEAAEALVAKISGKYPGNLPTPSGRIPDGFKGLADEYNRLKKDYLKAEKGLVGFDEMPLPDARTEAFTRVLLELTASAKEKYAEEKRRRARLDYADLEHLTVRLVENPVCADEIRARYRYIFVDEYQDVNPLQERIISAMRGASLFLVGDVKQSIYAFRMCDPNIFLGKYARYEDYGFSKPVELNANFRSASEILDFVNRVFSPLMTEDFGKIDYRNTAALTSGAGFGGGEIRLNLIELGAKSEGRTGVYSVLAAQNETYCVDEAEANRVVADIAELLEHGSVRQPDGTTRPVFYGDIAVLAATRSAKTALVYTKLKKAGVNVSLSDPLRFDSVPEIARLNEFMKYLVFGADDVALAAVLLSPIAELTEDELALVRMSGDPAEKRFYVLCEDYAAKKTDETAKKLAAFFALAARYREYARTHAACEVIGRLIAEKKLFPRVAAGDEPELKTDALTSYLNHLASSKYGSSVSEYVAYLGSSEAVADRSAATDAVSIMTIHASKGLEFPFVFLIDTDHKFNVRETYGKVLCDSELGVCMKNFDELERAVKTNRLTFAAGLRKRRGIMEESMRLLYVALTRAKQGLYVYASADEKTVKELSEGTLGFDPESADCFFDWLAPVYVVYGHKTYRAEDCVASFEAKEPPVLTAPDPEFTAALCEYYDAPKKNAAPHRSVKKSVTAIGRDEEEQQPEYLTGADDDRAVIKGNAYHRAMEKADYSLCASAAANKLRETEPSFALVDEGEFTAAFEAIRERVGERKIYREKQFVYNPGGTLVQGVIDLLVTDGNTCEIIDYKTSKTSTILSGAYDVQLAAYSLAAEEITGMRVTKASIYSFRERRFFDAEQDKLEKIKARLKSGEL